MLFSIRHDRNDTQMNFPCLLMRHVTNVLWADLYGTCCSLEYYLITHELPALIFPRCSFRPLIFLRHEPVVFICSFTSTAFRFSLLRTRKNGNFFIRSRIRFRRSRARRVGLSWALLTARARVSLCVYIRDIISVDKRGRNKVLLAERVFITNVRWDNIKI